MINRVNPFTPGPGLDPPYLAGRGGELRAFDDMLLNVARGKVRNMILHGLRGAGKTVLLKRFAAACRGGNFLPVARYQHTAKDSDPSEFAPGIKRAIRGAIESSPRAGAAGGGLRSAGQRPEPSSAGAPGVACYDPLYAHGRREPLVDHLIDYLAKNWGIIDDLGYDGAILFLDEFHTVSDARKDGWYTLADFLGAVNEVQKDGCRYSLVLSGLPSVLGNVTEARSYAERMFGLVEVSGLSGPDGRQAVMRPLAAAGVEFDPALVDAVVEDSGGHPYFVQFFAREILRRIGMPRIGVKEYEPIRGDLIGELCREFFDQRMVDMSRSEKSTLYHMSRMPEAGVRLSSIVSATGRGRGAVSSHLKRLEKKGIVYRHGHGLYAFALPMLGQYLSHAMGAGDS